MQELNAQLERLEAAIKGTPVYQRYAVQKELMAKEPELKARIDEFRQKNYELQTSEQTEDLFERIDQFSREYKDFRENPKVSAFLEAELALCRMMQEIHLKITQAVDFDYQLMELK